MARELLFSQLTFLLLLSCFKASYGMNNPENSSFSSLAEGRKVQEPNPPNKASLAIPPLLDTAKGKVELRAQHGTYEVISGIGSPSMGYNGQFLGPTILLHQGHQAQIEVINELSEGTTFHSHGAIIPGYADGGPTEVIAPGSSWLLQFQVTQRAATLWYHPHKVGRTAAQVWQGLAGLYIVSDPEIESLPLPKDYGIDDIPLVIQDRFLDERGKMLPYEQVASGHMALMNGVIGNAFLINGQLQPELQAASGWLRLRLLNGSNASSYRLSFRNPNKQVLNFYQIASEQGLLTEPQQRDSLDLTSGGRSEIMLELPNQADKIQMELALWNRNLTAPSKAQYQIMSIQVDPKRRAKGQLVLHTAQKTERGYAQRQASTKLPAQQRNFQLQMMTGQMMRYGINDQSFDINRVNFDVPKGRYEVWRFSTDMLGHPVHIHGVQFRILKSAWLPNGSPNWRDTFAIRTDQEAMVLLRFSENADRKNPYMLHCHMLEHEAAGMMLAFTVS